MSTETSSKHYAMAATARQSTTGPHVTTSDGPSVKTTTSCECATEKSPYVRLTPYLFPKCGVNNHLSHEQGFHVRFAEVKPEGPNSLICGLRAFICPDSERTVIRKGSLDLHNISYEKERLEMKAIITYPEYEKVKRVDEENVCFYGKVSIRLNIDRKMPVEIMVRDALVLDFKVLPPACHPSTGDIFIGMDVLEQNPFALIQPKILSNGSLDFTFPSSELVMGRKNDASYWNDRAPADLCVFIGIEHFLDTGVYHGGKSTSFGFRQSRTSYGIIFKAGSAYNEFGTIIWPSQDQGSLYTQQASAMNTALGRTLTTIQALLDSKKKIKSVSIHVPTLKPQSEENPVALRSVIMQGKNLAIWVAEMIARGTHILITKKGYTSPELYQSMNELIKLGHQAIVVPNEKSTIIDNLRGFEMESYIQFDPFSKQTLAYSIQSVQDGLSRSDVFGYNIGKAEIVQRYGYLPFFFLPLLEEERTEHEDLQYLPLPPPLTKEEFARVHYPEKLKGESAGSLERIICFESRLPALVMYCEQLPGAMKPEILEDIIFCRDQSYNGYVAWNGKGNIKAARNAKRILTLIDSALKDHVGQESTRKKWEELINRKQRAPVQVTVAKLPEKNSAIICEQQQDIQHPKNPPEAIDELKEKESGSGLNVPKLRVEQMMDPSPQGVSSTRALTPVSTDYSYIDFRETPLQAEGDSRYTNFLCIQNN